MNLHAEAITRMGRRQRDMVSCGPYFLPWFAIPNISRSLRSARSHSIIVCMVEGAMTGCKLPRALG